MFYIAASAAIFGSMYMLLKLAELEIERNYKRDKRDLIIKEWIESGENR